MMYCWSKSYLGQKREESAKMLRFLCCLLAQVHYHASMAFVQQLAVTTAEASCLQFAGSVRQYSRRTYEEMVKVTSLHKSSLSFHVQNVGYWAYKACVTMLSSQETSSPYRYSTVTLSVIAKAHSTFLCLSDCCLRSSCWLHISCTKPSSRNDFTCCQHLEKS